MHKGVTTYEILDVLIIIIWCTPNQEYISDICWCTQLGAQFITIYVFRVRGARFWVQNYNN